MGRIGRGCGGTHALSLGCVGEAAHKVPCRWCEWTLSESRERLVPVSAAPSGERCASGTPVRSVSPFLPADGEQCADGAGSLLPRRAGGVLVVVTSADRVLRGSATTSDMVANAGADFVYRCADDSQEPLARADLVHGALEWVGRDRARPTAHEPRTSCSAFRVLLASYCHMAGSRLGGPTKVTVPSRRRRLGAWSAVPDFAHNHGVALAV